MVTARDLSIGDQVVVGDDVLTVVEKTPATTKLSNGVFFPGTTRFLVARFKNEEETV